MATGSLDRVYKKKAGERTLSRAPNTSFTAEAESYISVIES